MIVFAKVNGQTTESGGIESITIDQPIVSKGPIGAAITAKNTGNVDYTLTESLSITDVFGKEKYAAKNVEHAVLPDQPRTIRAEWSEAPWFGLYKINVTATALGKTTEKTGYIMIVPMWMWFVLTALIIVAATGALRRKKASQKRVRLSR